MNEIVHLLNPWWRGEAFEIGIPRPKYITPIQNSLSHKKTMLLVGSRRVGKTTLLRQTIKLLLNTIPPKHILYLLLDHPQVSQSMIFELIAQFRNHFSLDRSTKLYLFLDEVQYMKHWEQEVKALCDTENVQIFLSGSASAELLAKKSFLTGRVKTYTMQPLDFAEFLQFKKTIIKETERYKYTKYCEEYLRTGGYPEYVLSEDPSYFSDLVNDVLYKDIIRMYDLKNPDVLRDLLLLLADRTGQQATFTKLSHILNVKNDTVKEYIYYLKNTFIIDELPRYATSRAKRIYAAKKFYITDNGMLYHLLGTFSHSAAFERTVYRALKDTAKSVSFYYENQQELDFVVERGHGPELWEAKYSLKNTGDDTMRGYIDVALKLNIKTVTIVTMETQKTYASEDVQIRFLPLWQLLLAKNEKK
ncbi:ATP-binding protein [Candidatus Gottesmanbacteria bacterium]|nr:ATP-binding protein [Candidatus Gottesmanbacteria bacterium]